MAINELQQANQLRREKNQSPRQSTNVKESPKAPGTANANPDYNRSPNDKTNPTHSQQALKLAKSVATGQRDKSKSTASQAMGEVGARGGQALGASIGSAIPVVGTAVGGAVGKRVGRLAGENWKKTLIIALLAIFMLMLPYILMLAIILISIMALGETFS